MHELYRHPIYNGTISKEFKLNTGVNKGCSLSILLFNILLEFWTKCLVRHCKMSQEYSGPYHPA